MKILDCQQGSVDWMQARAGIPTASEFFNLVTPEFKIRKGEMRQTYLAKKLAERWLGGGLADFNTFDMEQGRILEEEAKPWFEMEYDQPITRVGLITTDDGRIGCSPDGLIGDDSGIEIKCPAVHTHVKYLLAGELPPEYAPQVHGAMLVSGRLQWTFVSYCRRMPKLVLDVQRDADAQDALQEALDEFLADFDAAFARLCEINGGPPRRPAVKPLPHLRKLEVDLMDVPTP